MTRRYPALFLGALTLASSGGAAISREARADDTCAETPLNDELQLLRRLSLDLRGKLPSLSEYQAVIDGGAVPAGFVDDALASADFRHEYGRFLRQLLHVNLDYNVVSNVVNGLSRLPGSNIYWSSLRGTLYRGGLVSESCLDEPAVFVNGVPQTTCQNGVCKEGWVEVAPFWDKTTLVKVCAFDAQDHEIGQYGPCAVENYDRECGCGPNLDYCYRLDLIDGQLSNKDGYFYHKTEDHYIAALNEQVTRIGTRILEEGRPYTDLLETAKLEFNGPLVHLLKNKGGIPFPAYELDDYLAALPDLEYVDTDDWVEVAVEAPGAAGVLTSPFYLLRFASNRARANRFYQAFMCQEFVGPPDGLPPPADPLNQTPNLMVREGCNACHQSLEPAAAHWGRWNMIGVEHYAAAAFPAQNSACIGQGDDPYCSHYLTAATHPDDEPYLGWFKPLLFSEADKGHGDPAIAAAVAGGPRALGQKAIDSGAFASCTSRRVWSWIMGREPDAIDAAELQLLTEHFIDTNYDFEDLVRQLVESPAYRDHQYVLPEVTP
jgi:hypothetical protein